MCVNLVISPVGFAKGSVWISPTPSRLTFMHCGLVLLALPFLCGSQFFFGGVSSSSTPSSVPPVLHCRSCSAVASLLVGQSLLEDCFFLLRVFRVCPALFYVLPVLRLGVLDRIAHLHILFPVIELFDYF